MGGQEFLSNVAFYVSIAVVIGMAFMFAFLFAIKNSNILLKIDISPLLKDVVTYL